MAVDSESQESTQKLTFNQPAERADRIEPGVERSGTPGNDATKKTEPRRGDRGSDRIAFMLNLCRPSGAQLFYFAPLPRADARGYILPPPPAAP